MLELHIYGSAFDLPSVEIECLAAVALLRCSFQDDEAWSLVPSNNPNVSPYGELPALRDGNLWVAGFRDIAKYLREQCSGVASKDVVFDLTGTSAADEEAYLAFLELRGLPILDLSLYVSSDNYTNVMRSTLSEILSWPQSWYLPQRLRDAARKRSEHLGLSGLDVDATREKELKKSSEGISAAIPKSLQLPKKSVTSLLGSSAETARFRLEAVTADFFEPLDELLGNKSNFLGDSMTVLDCYALALLSQVNVKVFPQPWLREALHKYPRLVRWCETNTKKYFGNISSLPWQKSAASSSLTLGLDIINSIAEALPVDFFSIPNRDDAPRPGTSKHKDMATKLKVKHNFYQQAHMQSQMLRELTAIGTVSAALFGVLIYTGHLRISWPFRSAKPMRQGFGPAGAILGIR